MYWCIVCCILTCPHCKKYLSDFFFLMSNIQRKTIFVNFCQIKFRKIHKISRPWSHYRKSNYIQKSYKRRHKFTSLVPPQNICPLLNTAVSDLTFENCYFYHFTVFFCDVVSGVAITVMMKAREKGKTLTGTYNQKESSVALLVIHCFRRLQLKS